MLYLNVQSKVWSVYTEMVSSNRLCLVGLLFEEFVLLGLVRFGRKIKPTMMMIKPTSGMSWRREPPAFCILGSKHRSGLLWTNSIVVSLWYQSLSYFCWEPKHFSNFLFRLSLTSCFIPSEQPSSSSIKSLKWLGSKHLKVSILPVKFSYKRSHLFRALP